MNQEKIGNFIKKIRIENKLTQKELAEKLGVTFQAVSKWENGKNIPDILILQEFSRLFNVDINEILSGEANKTQNNKEINNKQKNNNSSSYFITNYYFNNIYVLF